MTRYLILVRHSISHQEPALAAHRWQLTDEGRARCRLLAEQLRNFSPDVVVTSQEPKAVQTAQDIADALGLPLESEAGLHEQRRETVAYASQAEFEASIRRLLEHPAELVFGEETGNQACDRFQQAVDTLLRRHPGKTPAAVTHGTVMTLFLAQAAGVEPFGFWKALGMPAYVVLTLPDYRVVRIVNDVTL